MIASLPMYWTAENAPAWQTFWKNVQDAAAQQGSTLPPLTPPQAIGQPWTDHWQDRRLALSQSCSLPFRTILRNRVTYVATFDFDIPGCPAGHYRSVAVMRSGAARPGEGLALAFNAPDSQSGWAAAEEWRTANASGMRWRHLLETGAHAASARAVAEGGADIAFLDIVTWRLLQKDARLASLLEVVAVTRPTPGLPLIAAPGTDVDLLRHALGAALRKTPAQARAAMGGLSGLVQLDPEAYHRLTIPPAPGAIVPS